MSDAYLEHAPALELRACVECYWTIASTGAPHRVLPDACSDLLFVVGRARAARFIGVMSRAIVTPPGEPATIVGVRFRPGAGAALLGAFAKESRDLTLPLDDAWGRAARELEERVSEATTHAARVAILDRELIARRLHARAPDPRVRAALAAMRDERTAVATIAARVGLSERQLERAFDADVGLGPKAIARVLRLQSVVRASARGVAWAEMAARFGYADQAHLIRDFRALAGLTPQALLRARAMSDLSNPPHGPLATLSA